MEGAESSGQEVSEAQRTVNTIQALEAEKSSKSKIQGKDGNRTFTSAPHVPRAQPHPRRNQTFSPDNLREIQRENQILVQRISAISARKNEFASDKPWSKANAGGGGPKLSSAEINRRRAANKIAQENLAMFKRLQAIKPSPDISRDRLSREHQQNQKYMRMHQTVKPVQQAQQRQQLEEVN